MTPRGMTTAEMSRRVRQVSTPVERAADYLLGVVSPRQALIRQHRRLMQRDGDYRDNWLGAMAARGYKSAASPTNGTPWLDSGERSADAELLLDLPTLRARSRALERNDALASGLIATRRRQVIGSGMRPQGTHAVRAWNTRLEGVWSQAADALFPAEGHLSFSQAQRVIYTRLLVDGEVFVKRTKTAPDEPVWFELVEADRVGTPLDSSPADPQGRIVDGIEKDRFGRVVAYHVSRTHPGDLVYAKTTGRPPEPVPLSRSHYVRVPADEIRHMRYRVTRPGQTRGLPLLHAVMQDFHDLDLLTLALLKRTQIAACLALFITSEQAVSDLFEVTAEDFGYQLDQQLEPGMLYKLYPGESVQSVIPGFQVPDVEPVQLGISKRIGAATEMSPEAVLHDWGRTNYSSARTVQIEDNRAYDTDRSDMAELLTWIWCETLLDAQMRGVFGLAGFDADDLRRVRWVGDARPWVDPASEAQATQIRLALGLTTLRDEAAAQGKDWEELLQQQADEAELREELGLPALSLPGAPAPGQPPVPQKGAPKGVLAGSQADDDEDEGDE